ncbi:NAD-dependent malic enzyme [Vibrio sp. MACH09]|uniref:NAD-dependent malic enzyme n=1 Tax=Vibrio sp. MACH09 TaxID=3025122 RepID=UPI00278E1001|nr:NAD-dependent malic enzyme [Vibrio sp. MACH09]GLO60622.1 NAD-dependent malic enzyme [Vibrio sp. MACH09]
MNNKQLPYYVSQAGSSLLETPVLNKGSAFTLQERKSFNLNGLLPEAIETIEEQVERAYLQYQEFEGDMTKHIYLRTIQDTNETLFYSLIQNHLSEMMPIIYTPTVGAACENFSSIYRRARGLIVSYPNIDCIDDILNNVANKDVRIIVVTDGERILGLGDQGIGGMGIPIGKLSLYTACGGINPSNTLAVVLDVGTDNPRLLSDPMYMGWRHPRIRGEEYDIFVSQFIQGVKGSWPDALIQFEDFAQRNAMPLLQKYQNEVCCFNDDIQGTAAVTVGTLLAACSASGEMLRDQTITFLGAGSAGCGIAEAIIAQMVAEGLTDQEARQRVFMVDRWGLLTNGMPNLRDFQAKLVQQKQDLTGWDIESPSISLLDVVVNAKPTVLVGVSGQPGLFTEEIIKKMHQNCTRPIVFPLSNPTSRVEATPEDILNWTNGEALVATGSPFEPVKVADKVIDIAQCNNSYIFPGIGLGVLAVGAKRVTKEMLMESSRALADCSPLLKDKNGAVLPPLEEITQVSKHIAFAVAKKAMKQKVAPMRTDERVAEKLEMQFWKPVYREYKRSAS